MGKKIITGLEIYRVVRLHPLMFFGALFEEVGSASTIANLLEIIYWGEFFLQPVKITISAKDQKVAVEVVPGEFRLEEMINSTFPPSDLGEYLGLAHWIPNSLTPNEYYESGLVNFTAIAAVVYSSRWFRWEIDTSKERISEEYVDGIPQGSPNRTQRENTSDSVTKFEFILSEDLFTPIEVPVVGVLRVFDKFQSEEAIPEGVKLYAEVNSSTDYSVTLK